MAAVKDPYKTLGVDKKASDDEIKKAYRKLARQYHPDTNPGDAAAEERFKEVQEAYAILSDPEKRKQYDSGGGIFGGGFDPRRVPRRGPGRLRRLRRHPVRPLRRRRRRAAAARAAPERGRDLETEVHISFEQAMEGAQVPVTRAARPRPARPATAPAPSRAPRPTVCSRCHGRGVEAESQGLFSISQPCRQCGGTGTEIKDPCPTCQRRGPHAPGQALPGEHPRRRARRQPGAAAGQGRGRSARRPAGRPVRGHARGRVADLQAQGRQPRGRGADHDPRGDPRRDDRGADAHRHEAHPRSPGHPARHGAAPARRGPAEARRPRPRRHPLPAA